MANFPAHPQPPPTSGPICPACAKAVDPIRAGHVAILGGRFVYFCNATCKQQHMAALGNQPEDVATMEPPAVAWGENGGAASSGPYPLNGSARSHGAYAAAPSSDPLPEPAAHFAPEDPISEARARTAPESSRTSSVRSKANGVAPHARGADATHEESAPRTLRSVSVGLAPAPLPRAAPTRATRIMAAQSSILRLLYAFGLAAGVLTVGVDLAGDVADTLRLPLFGFATIACLVRLLAQGKDPSTPNRLVAVLPVLGASGAALWAWFVHDAHAVRLEVLAGIASACVLGMDLLIERMRAKVSAARAEIARALDVDVRVVRGGGDETVVLRAHDVKPGEQVIVEAGEVIGVDAVVTAGEGTVIPWLDAPVELPKREGDSVVAGARVTSGRLRLTTTWSGPDRAWSKLVLSPALRVDVASPTASLARVAVERGAPVAAALVGIATFANGGNGVEAIAAASAAALAFGVRGAVSIVALHYARAHFNALRSGVVYKDARSFERAGFTDLAVLCARGTLLLGEPEIVAIESLAPGHDVSRVLALAAGAETASTHPFASAILRAARTRGVRAENVRNATVHAGLGVTALSSSGERLVVGSRALLVQEKVSIAAADERVSELEAQGRSVLLVAVADKVIGLLALQDGLRAGARAAVQRLLDARIEPVLLSGEARETCTTLGSALDIDHIRPEVLPTERGAEVRALGEGGHVVAVLGHPATDDSALGAADVAVAMGAAGATPGEWGIALASDDVRDAALALTVPHATRERVRVVLALGFVPGVLTLLALVFGIAPLAIAPIAATVGVLGAAFHAREKGS